MLDHVAQPLAGLFNPANQDLELLRTAILRKSNKPTFRPLGDEITLGSYMRVNPVAHPIEDQPEATLTVEDMDSKLEQNDATSTTTTSPSTEDPTPTETVVSDDFEGDIYGADPGVGEAVPWVGETFVIRDRESGKAIAVNDDGDVRLSFFIFVATHQSCHWKCVEKDGWFGFKHEGRYLGHNGRGGFHAEVKHHRAYEYFSARKHPKGGYQLMTLHGWVFRNMAIGKDGEELVETTNEGALWDFVKV